MSNLLTVYLEEELPLCRIRTSCLRTYRYLYNASGTLSNPWKFHNFIIHIHLLSIDLDGRAVVHWTSARVYLKYFPCF